MLPRSSVFAALLANSGLVGSGQEPTGCFFATSVDGIPQTVSECTDGDHMGWASDSKVREAIRILGLDSATIEFRGCASTPFATLEDRPGAQNPSFIITYPTSIQGDYLAPLVHELGHVFQLKNNGGYDALRKRYATTKRIELGADYLTGLVYREHVAGFDIEQFQANYSLTGLFVENPEQGHGTLAQRMLAFRYGAYQTGQVDFAAAHEDFQANKFGTIEHGIGRFDPAKKLPAPSDPIALNKLDDCDGVSSLHSAVENDFDEDECESVSGPLEEAVHAHLEEVSKGGEVRSCYLATPPARMVKGFSCFRTATDQGRDIFCFRRIDSSALRSYELDFAERYAASVSAYLHRAKSCSGTANDAAAAADIHMPWELRYISKFDFGFVSVIDRKSSMIVHGFASLDPAIAAGGAEFVWTGITKPVDLLTGVEEQVGGWTMQVDEMKPAVDAMQKSLKSTGIPFLIRMMSIEFRHSMHEPLTELAKADFIGSIEDQMAKEMDGEDFDAISSGELKRHGGIDFEKLQALASRQVGYGLESQRMMSKMFLYKSENNHSCRGEGQSLFVVAIMAMKPIEEVNSDFGSVFFSIIGLGNCARASAKEYASELTEQITNAIREKLTMSTKFD